MTNPDEPIFIGMEDGVAVYASRKNVSGADRAMQRDHHNRELAPKITQALWDMRQKVKDTDQ